jgi:hypothetical protein
MCEVIDYADLAAQRVINLGHRVVSQCRVVRVLRLNGQNLTAAEGELRDRLREWAAAMRHCRTIGNRKLVTIDLERSEEVPRLRRGDSAR